MYGQRSQPPQVSLVQLERLERQADQIVEVDRPA
jgi:hypothetical protein